MKIELERLNRGREPSESVDEYLVYELLGSGAFGSVYRVRRGQTGHFYALKKVDSYFFFRLLLILSANSLSPWDFPPTT